MLTHPKEAIWLASFASVPGPKRALRNTENQDALALARANARPDSVVAAAVADGHGASRYVRSRHGADLATKLATRELLSIAAEEVDASLTLTDIKRAVTERLPQLLHRQWVDGVTEHFVAHPLTEEEEGLVLAKRPTSLADISNRPQRIYGSTLLAALLTDRYAVFVQLGDGEIVIAEESGDVQSVFQPDEDGLGDETKSLGSTEAWTDIRVSFHPFIDFPPAVVMLSTDGYGKAFKSERAFMQVGTDLIDIIRAEGFEPVKTDLPGWLEEAASTSGDDATAIVLVRADFADRETGGPEAHSVERVAPSPDVEKLDYLPTLPGVDEPDGRYSDGVLPSPVDDPGPLGPTTSQDAPLELLEENVQVPADGSTVEDAAEFEASCMTNSDGHGGLQIEDETGTGGGDEREGERE